MADLGTLLVGIAALLTVLAGLPSMRRLHRKADDAVVAAATTAAVVSSIDASVNNIAPGAPTLRQTAERALEVAESTHRLVLGHVEKDLAHFDRIDERLGIPPLELELPDPDDDPPRNGLPLKRDWSA